MNLVALFHLLPTATVVAFIASTGIPALSSLLSREHWDSAVTGLLTLALASADGFFSQWAAHPSGFDWKAAVGSTVVAYVIAVLVRSGVLKGTGLDDALLRFGSKGGGDLGGVTFDEPSSPKRQDVDLGKLTFGDPSSHLDAGPGKHEAPEAAASSTETGDQPAL